MNITSNITSNLTRTAAAATAGLAATAALAIAAPAAHAADNAGTDAQTEGAQASTVHLRTTYTGYLAWKSDGDLVRDEPFTVTVDCFGSVVDSDGWIATAGWCVDPDVGIYELIDAGVEYFNVDEELTDHDELSELVNVYGLKNNRWRFEKPVTEIGVSYGADVDGVDSVVRLPGVLKSADYNGWGIVKVADDNLNALELGTGSTLVSGDRLTAIRTAAYEGRVTDATLKARPVIVRVGGNASDGDLRIRTSELYGAPLVDEQGRLVAVVEDDQVSAPVEQLVADLADVGVVARPSGAATAFHRGLAAFDAGDHAAAAEFLSGVTSAQPGNAIAARYLARAEDAIAAEEAAEQAEAEAAEAEQPTASQESMLPIGPLAGIGAGIAVLVALVVGLIVRVRRNRSRGEVPVWTPAPVFTPPYVPAGGYQGEPTIPPYGSQQQPTTPNSPWGENRPW